MKKCIFFKRLCCLLVVFVLVVVIAIFNVLGFAKADQSTTVYYYSDDEETFNSINVSLSQSAQSRGMEYISEYIDNSNYDYDYMYKLEQVYNVHDCIVIVEYTFADQMEVNGGVNTDYADFFEGFFSGLKENGCTVVFICSMDEMRFAANNDFLDYVDIHINKDLFFIAVNSFFQYLSEDVNSCSLVLDSTLSQGWFFRNYLIPFLRYSFNLSSLDYPGMKSVIQESEGEGFRTIAHFDSYRPYDFVYLGIDEEYNISSQSIIELMDYICEPNSSYAFGHVSSNPLFFEWYNFLHSFEDYGYTIPQIYYFGDGYDDAAFSELDINNCNFFALGNEYMNYMLPTILNDVLDGEDLSEYDNWEGRCAVTYKPVIYFEGAWALTPVYFPFFSLFMDEETWMFYFGDTLEDEPYDDGWYII